MLGRALAVVLVLIAVGCGAPSKVPEQADDLASISAEGALLAGDVADGDSTGPFARAHARALREKTTTLRGAISDAELRRVAEDVMANLSRLAASPSEREAARIERRLGHAARRAGEIGRRAA